MDVERREEGFDLSPSKDYSGRFRAGRHSGVRSREGGKSLKFSTHLYREPELFITTVSKMTS